MPRSDSLRADLARLIAAEAVLQRDLGRAESAAGSARAAAAKKWQDASRSTSDSSRRSAASAAEREDRKAAAAQKKIGDLTAKLAANRKSQSAKHTALTAAERAERQADERELTRRRGQEKSHAREVARLSRPTVHYVHIQPPKPEPLRVLYLTANPEATDYTTVGPSGEVTTVSQYLRLDMEVREVQRALRGAKYRDLIDVQHRPAATRDSLIEALNDVRPHVVHFSGHGSEDGIVLDSGDLHDPVDAPVTFELLAKVLSATDSPPLVVVLNACDTLAGAEVLLPSSPVLIAMAESIDDTAAVIFARTFYSAIASAQPIGRALEQARVVIELAALEDADAPQVLYRDDIDPEVLVLVRPE